MSESEARKLHAKAATLREEGKYLASLDMNDQALFAYDTEGDSAGFAEGIGCRTITLKDYANLHQSRRLLLLAKFELMGAVAIAKESGDPTALALPQYQLAQLQEDLGELSDAVKTYKDALFSMQHYPPLSHNRPSVIADMRVHMSACEYKAGDKSALTRLKLALADLEEAEEPDDFAKLVWVSGGYLRLAKILREDNLEEAKGYLQRAKEIIDSDPRLIVRKEQWQQLAATF